MASLCECVEPDPCFCPPEKFEKDPVELEIEAYEEFVAEYDEAMGNVVFEPER